MATGRVERRLAAILAADVLGYSQLMGVEAACERLKKRPRDAGRQDRGTTLVE